MSTLRANTLSDVAGTNSPDVTRGEFCRARANFSNVGVVTLRDGFNISSLTDNAVGVTTLNFTNAFPNNNYSVVGQCISPAVANGLFQAPGTSGANQAVGSILVNIITISPLALADLDYIEAIIVGDKS